MSGGTTPTSPPPRISILLLCWNHTQFLEQCIGALAGQSERDFEVVFLDNVSSDGSFEMARDLFGRFGLTATMLRNDQPHAIPANFNRLLAASSGDIVAPLSTDDWYEPDYVASLVAASASDPEGGWFSCGGWLYFDPEGRSEPIDDTRFVTDRPVGEVILDGGEPHFFVGCAYRRSALDAVGGWDETQLIEDRDLFLRLSQRYTHHRIDRRLVHYRRSSAAASANASFMVEGWERFFAKHAADFGPRLTSRRSETHRSYAALLTDQGDIKGALAAIGTALRLRPLAIMNWRTLAYVGRRAIGGRR